MGSDLKSKPGIKFKILDFNHLLFFSYQLKVRINLLINSIYSKTCLKRLFSKRPKMGLQDQLSLNAGQKYCRMLQWEHSAILSTCIELPIWKSGNVRATCIHLLK